MAQGDFCAIAFIFMIEPFEELIKHFSEGCLFFIKMLSYFNVMIINNYRILIAFRGLSLLIFKVFGMNKKYIHLADTLKGARHSSKRDISVDSLDPCSIFGLGSDGGGILRWVGETLPMR